MAEHIGNKPDVLSPRITIHTKIFQGGLFEYMRFEGKNLELSEKSPLNELPRGKPTRYLI